MGLRDGRFVTCRPDKRVFLYHAHSHYRLTPEAIATAKEWKETLQKKFDAEGHYFYGRTHEKPVGPHPEGQFELVFTRQDFAEVVIFLSLNRPPSVSIFIHPHTLEPVTASCPGSVID